MPAEADGAFVSQPADGGIQVTIGQAGDTFQFLITPLAIVAKGLEYQMSATADADSIHELKVFLLRFDKFLLGYNNELQKRFYLRGGIT